MRWTLVFACSLASLACGEAAATGSASPAAAGGAELLTQRYDNARTGANLQERTLAPGKLGALSLLGAWPVDGEIYAQILVASDVFLDGKPRAVALVATMNDTLYAFDADAPPAHAFLWQRGMGELGTPAYSSRNIGGPNGILSTPVVDKARGLVYLVARDCDPSFAPEHPSCRQRLIAVELQSGAIRNDLPIAGQVAVIDADGGKRALAFDPSAHWNRPGLLLAGDQLAIAFGSGPAGDQHEEDFVYHGWLFRYDARDLSRAPEVYCTTPRGRGGAVWQAGSAPAADDDAIYFTGANGIMDDGKTHPAADWPARPKAQEDSVIRLPLTAALPTPQDAVTSYWDARDYIAAGNVFQHMESGDNGFGSSGPTLIPQTALLLVGTKAGLVYLLDRNTLQEAQAPLNPFTDQPLQPGHTLYLHSWWGIPAIPQAFVFFRAHTEADGARYGYAYAWASNDRLRSLRFDYTTMQLASFAVAAVPDSAGGGNAVLSADGGDPKSALLWVATRSASQASPGGTLWAFDPLTLEVLWQTETPAWSKFTPPSVLRGRVFLPSTAPNADAQQVLLYGLPDAG